MHHANRTPGLPSTNPITNVVSEARNDTTAAHNDNHDGAAQSKGKHGYPLMVASGSSAAATLFPVLLEASVIVTATAALAIFIAVIVAALAI
ncbi:hypothetical protein ABI214_08050 [Prescottella soli]|uniref:Uncharacterized protein n=1 Tax=Prescottella soli TaxID=1543852 RepID=A0ABW9FNP4_9NOCA